MVVDLVGKVGGTISVTECKFYACCFAVAREMLDGVYDVRLNIGLMEELGFWFR
jgi:hypothetical protein